MAESWASSSTGLRSNPPYLAYVDLTDARVSARLRLATFSTALSAFSSVRLTALARSYERHIGAPRGERVRRRMSGASMAALWHGRPVIRHESRGPGVSRAGERPRQRFAGHAPTQMAPESADELV